MGDGYMSLEVRADQVVEAMVEQGYFADRMWAALVEALGQGRLLDDLVDIVEGLNDPEAARVYADRLEEAGRTIRSLHVVDRLTPMNSSGWEMRCDDPAKAMEIVADMRAYIHDECFKKRRSVSSERIAAIAFDIKEVQDA